MKNFFHKVNLFANKLRELYGKKVLIVSHNDADGISSASILSYILYKLRISFNTRILKELTPLEVDSLSSEGYDFYLISDHASGLTNYLDKKIKNYLILDHHEIPEFEKDHDKVLNPWQFNIDGSSEISSSGVCYFLSKELDVNGGLCSSLALIGALGDRQDQGEGRKLCGLNEEIVKDAQKVNYLQVKKDLLIYGSETKPLHKLLAYLEEPLIPELFGKEDKCLEVLNSYQINLKEGLKWRTLSDLNEEEKKNFLSIIAYYTKDITSLIGERYILCYEEPHSPLRDAREYATLLNACGRLKRSSLGVSLALGDRSILDSANEILSDYKKRIFNYINMVQMEKRRGFYLVKGEGFLDENFTGAIASLLIGRLGKEIILVRTTSDNSYYKVSLRSNKEEVDLGKIIRKVCGELGEIGGGHKKAGGAKVSIQKMEDFLKLLEDELSN